MADHYRTLTAPAEFRAKIERSEFLGLAFPCVAEDAFFTSLQQIEKKHFDATHHCWAFRLFADSRQRSSDAGEPSGTAGKPILSALEGADLFDAGVVVVRWYGGVKLGTGGLSRAYRDTAAATLRIASTVERLLYDTFEVEVPFDAMSGIYRLVDPPHIVLRGESFGDRNVFTIDVRRSRSAEFARTLTDRRFAFTIPTPQ
jgi:uncharacterized YigZ family protein